jgi:hypothetical protein
MLLFTKPGTAQQTIQLHLSDDGEYWTGAGGTLRDLSPNQRKDRLYLSRGCTQQGRASVCSFGGRSARP